MNKFDAIIIGTGQAGPSLVARFAAEGKKTAIVERKLFGGTCVNKGCTPTKASILGIEGDEIIHSILDIMYADVPYTVIQSAVHIHPTVSELIPTTLV